MPPAGFIPIIRPVSSYTSRIASSMQRVTGSVAAPGSLPVEVLMKSAPAGIARVGPNRLRRQRCHLARGVLAFERRQIHHSHGQLEREDLSLALDRSFRQRGGALFERHGVHRADSRQPRLERKLKSTWENR